MAPPKSPKRSRKLGHKDCTCSICGAKANSTPGSKHRRCSGSPNKDPRPKHSVAAGNRGVWE